MIRAVQADITTLQVDAVVNAANRALVAGGGVNGAIHRAAGAAVLSAACAVLGGCDPGDAKATLGFHLPASFIIHTVGPVWQGGGHGEAAVLASCYRRAIEVGEQLGITSIAFPAISTGAFGFPVEKAARIAVDTLRSLETTVQQILLVAIDLEVLRSYQAALGD